MNDKLGRNDPCHCGSGKKYKRCCIDQDKSHIVVADFELQKLRKTEGEVVNEHLFPYIVPCLNSKVKCDNLIFGNKIKDCRNESIPSIYLERKA